MGNDFAQEMHHAVSRGIIQVKFILTSLVWFSKSRTCPSEETNGFTRTACQSRETSVRTRDARSRVKLEPDVGPESNEVDK